MNLKTRLAKLEAAAHKLTAARPAESRCRDFMTLWTWLEERGYADCLAAIEAGESGPAGLDNLFAEQARYDTKDRAWARIEAALDADQLPADADLELMRS